MLLEVLEGGIGRGKLGTSVGDTGGWSGPGALGCSTRARFEGNGLSASKSSEGIFRSVLGPMVAKLGMVKWKNYDHAKQFYKRRQQRYQIEARIQGASYETVQKCGGVVLERVESV